MVMTGTVITERVTALIVVHEVVGTVIIARVTAFVAVREVAGTEITWRVTASMEVKLNVVVGGGDWKVFSGSSVRSV